jgi:hypothetical protein
MNKLALKAIAKLTHVELRESMLVTRHNPILGSEIYIDEELINLEEAIAEYRIAAVNLQKYPTIRSHLVVEKRLILKHCLGLIGRMLHGKDLPYTYSKEDIDQAVRKLVRLIVEDIRLSGIKVDEDILQALHPFMTFRQRYSYRQAADKRMTTSGLARVLPPRLAFIAR